MCHSSTRPPNVQVYVIVRDQFYHAFPHVSTAGSKHRGKKAWVRGQILMSLPINDAIFWHGLLLELYKGSYSVYAIILDESPNIEMREHLV